MLDQVVSISDQQRRGDGGAGAPGQQPTPAL